MKKKRRKKWVAIPVIICCIVAAGAGGLRLWLYQDNSISVSLASASTEKVSEPFNYSGYSTAEYSSYTKTSEYVEMSDGVKLAVDIYLPADGPDDDTGSYPVVFQYTPYGRAYVIPVEMTLLDRIKMKIGIGIGIGTADHIMDRANSHDSVYGSSDTIVQTLLSYGYAYVCADIRGTGASYGVKIDFMPEIGTDGAELIDWIADQDWSDGNVGMFGGSYLGYSQLVTAAQDPEALKAIFPEVVAMDGFSTEMRPGGVFCELYSSEDIQTLYEMNNYLPDEYVYPTAPVVDEDGDGELWDEVPLDLDGDGDFLDDYNYPEDPDDEPQYADGNSREHIYYLATYEHKSNVPYNTLGSLVEYIDSEVELGSGEHSLTISAYEASPSAYIADIMETDIAIYNHGSWMDTFITSTTELYNTMKSTNSSRMIIDPGYHETESPFWEYCGEDEESSMEAYAIELVRFYDCYLKGIENGIDTESPIYLYNMNGDGWRFEDEFPLARQVETDYYLAQDGMLTTELNAVETGADDYQVDLTQDSSWESEWYDYGVSRYVMAAPDEVPDRTEMDELCLTYMTEAVTEDTEVTGYPVITFYASSTSDDADFYVYMEDVDEDGNAVLVTEGVLTAGFAATYDNDTMIQGGTDVDVLPDLIWHGFEEDQYVSDIFADDAIVELAITLFPTSWTFLEGHSIRISIACANSPTFATNSALSEDTIVTVYRDSEHQSKITLPIISE
ncbi:MAG: CocE/NonD family hydrolase [Clostridiales bacterium]|nr:CocE/NonD family hydrolase [Clostridiales bacterium]